MTAEIDIDRLSPEELMALNRRIVERQEVADRYSGRRHGCLPVIKDPGPATGVLLFRSQNLLARSRTSRFERLRCWTVWRNETSYQPGYGA